MAGPMGDLPLRPREMRDRNRALVLDAVARHQPVTWAQLAARTGLTKSSVSSIVGELLATRLVVEPGTRRGGDVGRPCTELVLARDGLAGLGWAGGERRLPGRLPSCWPGWPRPRWRRPPPRA